MVPPNSITVTALQLLNAAATEIGVLAGGESLSLDDAAWVLQKLQRVLDTFNAKRVMVYANVFSSFNLVPNLAPHTIGPTGTFAVNQRPVEIVTAAVQLTSSSPVTEVDLYRMTKDEWAAVQVKSLTSTFPTAFYYEPDWPLGSIFFWPIPTAVNGVLLQTRSVIGQITAYNASFSMPPAYWDAVVYSLAIAISPSFERPVSADLRGLWSEAMRAVQSNNIKSPLGTTRDVGMPGGANRGGDFNWLYGGPARN